MDGVKKLHAHEIDRMTHMEVLRTLATSQGVDAFSRRMAEVMLAGPEIADAEAEALRGCSMNRSRMAVAVARAYL